jgi:hypothetical protein
MRCVYGMGIFYIKPGCTYGHDSVFKPVVIKDFKKVYFEMA